MEEPIDTGDYEFEPDDVVTDEELRLAMAWHLGHVVSTARLDLSPGKWTWKYYLDMIDVTVMIEKLFDKGVVERPDPWGKLLADWDKD